MIIADEASDVITSSGSEISGSGGAVAEEAIISSLEILSQQLKPKLDFLDIYGAIQASYKNAASRIEESRSKNRTTLLISFLYVHSNGNNAGVPIWHYAYVGDGRLTLASPSRKVNGWTTESALLLLRNMGVTSTIGAEASLDPVVGSRLYAPGDFLIGASDGIDGPMQSIWDTRKILLPQLVEGSHPVDTDFPQRLATEFRGLRFSDDAVLGSITTNMEQGTH